MSLKDVKEAGHDEQRQDRVSITTLDRLGIGRNVGAQNQLIVVSDRLIKIGESIESNHVVYQ